MKKFLESNLFYGIVAVILAIFLMFYVDSSENPLSEKSFNNVAVTITNMPEGYLLEKEPGPVEIRVNGYRSTLNTVFTRDIKATLDLKYLSVGTNTYKVQPVLPSGLTLVHVKPEFVELTIDEAGVKTLPVNCRTYNEVAPGFGSLEPAITPATIVITGPQKVLDQVATAEVSVDLDQRSTDFYGDLPVVLLDKDNQKVEDERINLSSKEVAAVVLVTESKASKSVSVRTALSGSIDENLVVAGVLVRPSTVKISGSYGVISEIDSLTTEPIDLSSLTDSFLGFVKLQVPPNIEVLDGNEVEVTIRVEENLAWRVFDNIPIEIRNGPGGKNYGALPLSIDVTLAASPQFFEQAYSGGEYLISVKAYIDLGEEPADDRDYPIMLEYPAECQVIEQSHSKARVYAN